MTTGGELAMTTGGELAVTTEGPGIRAAATAEYPLA